MAAGESAWFRCFRPLCFSVEKRRISGKTVHFPSCGFSAKKRQISRKTVDFPGCGFSAKNGRFPEKQWIFQAVDFPRKNVRFPEKRCIFQVVDFPRKNGGFPGKRCIFRVVDFPWKNDTFPEKTVDSPRKNYISRENPPCQTKSWLFSKIHVFLRFFTVMPIMTPTAARMNATATEAATTEPGLEKNAFFSTGGLGRSDSSSAVELTLMVMTCE